MARAKAPVAPQTDRLDKWFLRELGTTMVAEKRDSPAQAFAKTYRNDPVAFVHDCFVWRENEGPTAYQNEIMSALLEHKRVAIRGPHTLGKSAMAAWLTLWFALTRDAEGTDWKTPTTASAWRQLKNYLWPEIKKWANRLRWDKLYRDPFDPRTERMSLSLRLNFGEAFAAASDTAELLEGAHADSLLYIFDESKAIPDETFDAAEGAFAGAGKDTRQEAFAFVISTPGLPLGRFYDIHARKPGFGDWWVRHVTLEECIAAGRLSHEWAEQRHLQWGDTAVYYNRVLGEFHGADEGGIIPLNFVEAAMERWKDWQELGGKLDAFTCVSCDPARSGDDKTVIAPRYGDVITELRRYSKQDTMATAGRVTAVLNAQKGQPLAVVDVNGIGAGVVDRLREQKKKVFAFNGAEKCTLKDRSGELGFVNKRAYSWWHMRELLDPAYGSTICLPPDDKLLGDLVSAKAGEVNSKGQITVRSKDELKALLGRSPDDGDAVVMAFAVDARPALPFGWVKLAQENKG